MNNLKMACIEYNKEWMASLPENPPEVEFSKRHQRKMKKLFDKMRGNHYHRFTRRTMGVMVTAALLTALSLCAFANPDFRAYVIDELNDHAIFQSLFESEKIVDGKIECGYIPEGFEVTDDFNGNLYCTKSYENKTGLYFTINKVQNGDEMGVDNEYAEKYTVQTSDKELVIYEKENGDIRIVWCDANYTYRLGGNISYDEAMKIAERVK